MYRCGVALWTLLSLVLLERMTTATTCSIIIIMVYLTLLSVGEAHDVVVVIAVSRCITPGLAA